MSPFHGHPADFAGAQSFPISEMTPDDVPVVEGESQEPNQAEDMKPSRKWLWPVLLETGERVFGVRLALPSAQRKPRNGDSLIPLV
jgi:hypothetical protein